MGKPVILAVDDAPQVLRAVERDLRRKYAHEYRVLCAATPSPSSRPDETRFAVRLPIERRSG